jgi:hypothetical protein
VGSEYNGIRDETLRPNKLSMDRKHQRLSRWWAFQIWKVFNRLEEGPQYAVKTHENWDRYPQYFHDMLTDDDIEEWLAEKFLSKKCIPSQVLMLWRQRTVQFSAESITRLLQKVIGDVEN